MTYTLLADGTSDAVLMPIITWSLKRHNVTTVFEQYADSGRIPRPLNTVDRVQKALDLYPCDVLFFHRDAEAQPWTVRRDEIATALRGAKVKHVPVIPVRMTETWLLADESAIRLAAGNPNGTAALNLPDLRRLEDLPHPKLRLYEALREASGRNARRRSQLDVDRRVHLIPNYIDDYSRLDVLPAFQRLQNDIRAALLPPK